MASSAADSLEADTLALSLDTVEIKFTAKSWRILLICAMSLEEIGWVKRIQIGGERGDKFRYLCDGNRRRVSILVKV